MHLVWINEASGEHQCYDLKHETCERGDLLNITEGIRILTKNMKLGEVRELSWNHAERAWIPWRSNKTNRYTFRTVTWNAGVYVYTL